MPPAELCCPIHREPLDRSDPARWVGVGHGEIYPVIDGIPILLPDRAQRDRIAQTDWEHATASNTSALDFYNAGQSGGGEQYYPNENDADRARLLELLRQAPPAGSGCVLEVGSGGGRLQGIGDEDYLALDYSFTALRRFIEPKWTRVCATAERLPLRDDSVRLLYSVTCLEHVPRADLAFAEIDRVLMPGGIAYVCPAWHCAQWVCDGVRMRPYRDLTVRQKLVKFTLPLRRHRAVKAFAKLPRRALRRATWRLAGGAPTSLHYAKLRAEYEHFWESDCDACSSLDSHEAVLFFASRRYDLLNPRGGTLRQLMTRHEPVVVRKLE
jgi:SAM-dependent methyltransferase